MIKKKIGRPAASKKGAAKGYGESLHIMNLQTELEGKNFKIANLEHQAIGYKAVIDYLEHKLS
jgi:hypothetical protein